MLTKPDGVRSLVLASPALSVRRWVEDADRLKKTLPEATQQAIATHERDGTFEAPEYQAAVMEYYQPYVCRTDPWRADVNTAIEQVSAAVYGTMRGPSAFTATGTLKDYERTEQLKTLHLPVLFTAGRFDEATPETTAYLTMQDEPEAYVQTVREFLRAVESP